MKKIGFLIVTAIILIMTFEVKSQKQASSLLKYDKQIDGIIKQMTTH